MVDLHSPLVDALLDAVIGPLDEKEVWTADMSPWRQDVGVAVGPVTLTLYFQLVRPATDLAKALSLGPAMELSVASVLRMPPGKRCPVRVAAAGAFLSVDIPRPDPQRPTLADLAARADELFLLGLDQRGLPVHLDLDALQTGLLVVGASGSGKTNAMALVALQALAAGWELAIVDLKGGRDWSVFESWARWGFAATPDAATRLLATLTAEVDRRNRPGVSSARPILLVFDELPRAAKDLQERLADLTAVGRAADLRTLAGSQRAGRAIAPMIKQNLRSRLVGLVADKQESADATGQSDAGAEQLLSRGDMLLIVDGGPPERVQVAQVLDRDDLLPDARDRLDQIPQPLPAGAPVTETEQAPAPRPADRGPVTLATEIARLRHEAEAAGDGRVVPPERLLSWAVRYAQKHGRVPSFGQIREWTRAELDKVLPMARMNDVRGVAARAAGLVEERAA